MFQTQAVSPIIFRFHISMQAKIIRISSCSEKSGKTGKNAPSVTGGQRVVTFCAGVMLGDMTDEISGKGINSFVSTGPKSYSFKYGDDEQKSAIKGFTLNHENNNLLNHDNLSKIV